MWTRSLAFAEELGQQPSDEERAQAEELFKTIGGVLYECMTVREIVDWAKLRPLSKRAPVLRPAAKPTDEIRRTFALRMKQAFDGFHCYSDGSKDLKQARRDFVDAALLAVEGREHARSTRLAVYKRLGI
jgi:hypothetical protein